jgi:tetratricopeptide (TPR) repeat protein
VRLGRFDEAREDVKALAGENRVVILNLLRRTLEFPAERLFSPAPVRQGVAETNSARDLCLSWCDLILAIEPEDATALLLRTLALAQAERYEEAEEAFQAVVRAGPEDLVVENFWALAQGTRAFRYGTNSPFRFGILVKRSQWLLDRLIEMQPGDWRFLVKRAEFALGEERMDDALADIDRAAELGPAKKVAEQLTFMRSSIPRQERTLEWLREEMRLHHKVLELDPDHEAARNLLGHVHGRLGEWKEALRHYTQLEDLDDENFTFSYRLAPLLVKTGQKQRCRELFQGRTYPSLPLADAYPDKPSESYIKSLRDFLEEPDLSAWDRSRYQSYLGCAYLRSGRHAEAIEWLEKPIEAEENYDRLRVRNLSMLAMAQEGSDDHVKAQELLSQAEEHFAEDAPRFGVEDGTDRWCDWLICQLLLEEAKEKVAGAGEPDEVGPEQEKPASERP